MAKLSLNSIPTSVFKINGDSSDMRSNVIGAGRLLTAEYARKGLMAVDSAKGITPTDERVLSSTKYRELNEKFQEEHMMYAARVACGQTGEAAPENFDEFKRAGNRFYGNARFYAVLQGIYEEILTPILPRIYSEAVDAFADTVSVGFGETYALTVDSNDIPVFQDSAWGASRSVPRNRFYAKDYTLNPQPKTAQINAKWHQLVGNDMDFGRWFANITAGLYAKTMGMFSAAMTKAATDTTLIPTGLTYTFEAKNWVTLANKISAVNNVGYGSLIAYGSAVALSKVLPLNATGSANTSMDSALATLLGADYVRTGYLGQYMGVALRPLMDAVIPGTQNGDVKTILPEDKIWMLATTGRKPLTIAMNTETPITLEFDPTKTADFEIGINMTVALDMAAIFASKIGLITVS